MARWRAATVALALAMATVCPHVPARESGAAVRGDGPLEQLRRHTDALFAHLDDRRAADTLAAETFDAREIAQRALGDHWTRITATQQDELTRLLLDLVVRSYFARLERYRHARLEYVGESIRDDRATVDARIVRKNGNDVPVAIRMRRSGPRWRVHDVIVRGVSLVGNYRAQFATIIERTSYEDLLQRLTEKRDQLARAEATARAAAGAAPRGR